MYKIIYKNTTQSSNIHPFPGSAPSNYHHHYHYHQSILLSIRSAQTIYHQNNCQQVLNVCPWIYSYYRHHYRVLSLKTNSPCPSCCPCYACAFCCCFHDRDYDSFPSFLLDEEDRRSNPLLLSMGLRLLLKLLSLPPPPPSPASSFILPPPPPRFGDTPPPSR